MFFQAFYFWTTLTALMMKKYAPALHRDVDGHLVIDLQYDRATGRWC
jgi:hypothetical protein